MRRIISIVLLLAVLGAAFSQEKSDEERRRDTIRYGTDSELLNLVMSLEKEGTDYLDDELIAVLRSSRNAKLLQTVYGYLGRKKKGGAEDRAIQSIQDWDTEDAAAVEAALSYLGTLEVQAAIPALREMIENGDESFLLTTIRTLGKCGTAEEAQYLLDYAQAKERTPDIELAILVALGEIASEKGLPYIREMLESEETTAVRRMAALEALSKIGSMEGKDAVLSALEDADSNVRAAAIAALGPFSGEDVERAIIESFRDSYYKSRLAACKAAAQRKLTAALPYLEYRANQDEVPSVREEAVRAIGTIGSEQGWSMLERLIETAKAPDRIKILSAEALLAEVAVSESRIALVLKVMDKAKIDKRTVLYHGLAKAVTGVRTPNLEARTRAFLESSDVVDRHYGLDLVILNRYPSMAPLVEKLLIDKNTSLARKAKQAAEALGIPSANPQ